MEYLIIAYQVFNLLIMPAIYYSLAMTMASFFIKDFLNSPKKTNILDTYFWFFKGFYILWLSLIKRKKYKFKLKIDKFDEVDRFREFCIQNFYYLFSVRVGIVQCKEREDYYKDILSNKITMSIVNGVISDEPPMHINIKFLFEKDALWFALHFGDNIV